MAGEDTGEVPVIDPGLPGEAPDAGFLAALADHGQQLVGARLA